MAPTKIDEVGRRKPEFREGYKIRLADGQEWTFPSPRLRLFPARNPETGQLGIGGGPTHGPEYNEMLDAFLQTGETEVFERLELQLRMAAFLLLQNYTLSDEELSTLLVLETDCPESQERWARINPMLVGQSPKLQAGGSATPS